jgi:undecaprenyl-diphosphatase
MDYRIDHAFNLLARHHPLLASVVAGFADWGVIAFGAAAVLVWFLAPPGGSDVWKRAGVAGLAAATLGLAANQAIIQFWQRPRPYQAHPHGIVPLLARSGDPSFPSDHASAAFGIAIGILLVHRRAGYLFLVAAVLIAASRVATGMHYPTDVLAGAAIGATSGVIAARVAMEPLLRPLIRVTSRVADPVVGLVRRQAIIGHTLLDARVRAAAVALVGMVFLAQFAWDVRTHLLDELPLSSLALWVGTVATFAYVASRHVDDQPSSGRLLEARP